MSNDQKSQGDNSSHEANSKTDALAFEDARRDPSSYFADRAI